MTYRVVLQPEARLDLIQATEYIAERAPMAAERWAKGFLASVKALEEQPDQWPLAEESPYLELPLREWQYRTKSSVTRAVFLIVGDEVRILRIRRPGQDSLRKEDLP
jgi:plasmid stabilization system protein ParE